MRPKDHQPLPHPSMARKLTRDDAIMILRETQASERALKRGFIYMTPFERGVSVAASSPFSCALAPCTPAPCPRSGPVPWAASC